MSSTPKRASTKRKASSLPGTQGISQLIHKRTLTLDYLKRLYSGHGYFYSTVHIPSHVIGQLFDTPNARKIAIQWFQLGLGLGSLLRIPGMGDFIRAVDALLSDYQHYISGSESSKSKKGKFNFPRLNKDSSSSSMTGADNSNNGAGMSLLEIHHVVMRKRQLGSIELDIIQVFLSLCDILSVVYTKIQPEALGDGDPAIIEHIFRIDTRLKKLVISGMINEMEPVARVLMKEQMQLSADALLKISGRVRPAASSTQSPPADATATGSGNHSNTIHHSTASS